MEMIKLEDVYRHPSETYAPVVAIDLRVEVFLILSKLKNVAASEQREAAKAFWCKKVNNPFSWLPMHPYGYRVCLLDDHKYSEGGYWRNKIFPEYKKGRADKPEQYWMVHDTIHEYLKAEGSPIPIFHQEGFEADDFAGVIFRNKGPLLYDGRNVFLNTVDTDWLQLVDDDKGIIWACNKQHPMRLRTEFEMYKYFAAQGNVAYHPRDVIELKYSKGDPTDNYGPGTTRDIIDLRDPPEKPDETAVIAFLEKLESNTDHDHLRMANQWLWQRGYQ